MRSAPATAAMALVAFAVTACERVADADTAPQTSQPSEVEAAPAPAPAPSSRVDGLTVSAPAGLPANAAADNGDCYDIIAAPETRAGRIVADRGWAVLSEQGHDGVEAVVFAGKASTSTSGSCALEDSRAAIYRAGDLVALIESDGVSADHLTRVGLSPAGILRLHGGMVNYDMAVADVAIDANRVIVDSLPDEDRFCDGSVGVPNVRGEDIRTARDRIIAAGWETVPGDPENRWTSLPEDGVIEMENCSGTGFGLCRFAYARASGETLGVVSMGETHAVSGFSVTCQAAAN